MIQPYGTTGFLLWSDPWRSESRELFIIYDDYSTSVFHCANKDNHLLLANECEQEALFTCFFSQNGTCDGWIIRTAEQSAVFIPDLVAKKYNDDLVCEGHPIWTCISQCKGQPRATSRRTSRSPILNTSIIATIWSGYERRQKSQGYESKGHPQGLLL